MAGAEHTPLAFSDLQSTVGVEDNGKFNYHLSQVAGHYVEKTDEGYQLRPAGIRVFQAIRSGSYATDLTVEPQEVDSPCVDCDGNCSVWYENGRVYSGCKSCDDVTLRYPLPPGMFDPDEPGSLADAASKRLSRDQRSFLRGVCPYCSGDVEGELITEKPEAFTDKQSEKREVFGAYSCRQCYWFLKTNLGSTFREHSAIISFYYERGVNLYDIPQWENPADVDEAVITNDPLTASVTFHCDDDARRIVVDDDLTVVDVEDL